MIRLSGRFDQVHRDRIINEMRSEELLWAGLLHRFIYNPRIGHLASKQAVLPVTEFQASRSLALPFFNRIRNEEINEVRTLAELIRLV